MECAVVGNWKQAIPNKNLTMSKWLKPVPKMTMTREEFISIVETGHYEIASNVWLRGDDHAAWEVTQCTGDCNDARCKGWKLSKINIKHDPRTAKIVRAFLDEEHKQAARRYAANKKSYTDTTPGAYTFIDSGSSMYVNSMSGTNAFASARIEGLGRQRSVVDRFDEAVRALVDPEELTVESVTRIIDMLCDDKTL